MIRKLLLALGVAVALLLLAVGVLLFTSLGLRGALWAGGLLLPGAFEVAAASGRLVGPLQLEGLRVETAGVRFAAGRLDVDWRPRQLWSGSLEVTELSAADVELVLPPGEADAEPARREPPPVTTDWSARVDRLRVERLRLVPATGEAVEVEHAEASGGLKAGVIEADLAAREARGSFRLEGRIDTRARYRHRLELVFEPPDEVAPIRLLSVGDLDSLALEAEAPAWDARVDATVREPLSALTWEARAAAVPPGVERARVAGTGTLDSAVLSAEIDAGGYQIRVDPLALKWTGDQLQVSESVVRIPGIARRIGVEGTFEPDTEPRFDVALDLIADTDDPAVRPYLEAARGRLKLSGTIAAARLTGTASLETPRGPIALNFEADGDLGGVDPLRLRLSGDAGQMELLGAVSWDPEPAWHFEFDATDLDPGVLWPAYAARLELAGRTAGRAPGGAIEGTLDLETLAGSFRQQPVSGHGSARLSAAGVESAALDLAVGDSRITVEGQWAAQRSADADVRVVDLGQVLPAAGGALEARIELAEDAGGVRLRARGTGTELAFGDWRAAALDFSAASPAVQKILEQGELRLTRLGYRGAAADALELTIGGAWSELRLEAEFGAGELGQLGLGATVDASQGARSGRIDRLDWRSAQYGTWNLREAAAYRAEAQGLALDRLCLDHRPGLVCVGAEAGPEEQRWTLELAAVPAELAQVPLSIALERPLRIAGEVSGNVVAQAAGDLLTRINGTFDGQAMALSLDFGRGWHAFSLGTVRASIDGDADRLMATVGSQSEVFSTALEAAFERPGTADARLQARLQAEIPRLDVVGEFLALPVTLGGRGEADLRLAGSVGEPAALDGRIELSEVAFEVAEYGSRWHGGRLEATFDGSGRGRLDGTIEAEQGTIRVRGDGSLADGRWGLELTGTEVRVAQTPTLLLDLSPDLKFSADATGYRLAGSVDVDRAQIEELETAQAVAPRSADVVVVDDPAAPPGEAPVPLSTDVRVRFRNPAELELYGMSAQLSGELRVVDAPSEPVLATGELRVGGTYQAYGQDLTLEEGRLIYAQTPLDNPSIRANAYREVGDVRVGVRISGRAAEPQLALFSNPTMSDNEILSYLILGRPSSAGGDFDSSEMVTNAALSLGLRQGNNVVGQVGSKLGFDQLSIGVDDEFGGAAVSIGRYLSPRLYLSYSTGLVQAIDLLRFEYKLGRKWTLQSEIGVQTRTTMSYELETGRPKPAPEDD